MKTSGGVWLISVEARVVAQDQRTLVEMLHTENSGHPKSSRLADLGRHIWNATQF